MATNNNLNVNSLSPLSPVLGGTGVDNTTNTLTVTANSTINQNVSTTGNPVFSSVTFNSTSEIIGTTTNNSAAAGSVGEYLFSQILYASSVTIPSTGYYELTNLVLTPGDWDAWGSIYYQPQGTTVVSYLYAWISTSASALPDASLLTSFAPPVTGTLAQQVASLLVMPQRISIAAPTTYYCATYSSISVSTATMCGFMAARRVR